MKKPFRIQLFQFLITPAELWIHLSCILCGLEYQSNIEYKDDNGDI